LHVDDKNGKLLASQQMLFHFCGLLAILVSRLGRQIDRSLLM